MALKSIFNWSGGKDSALALYHVLHDPHFSVDRLLTSVNRTYERISMHGIRETLLEQQAMSLGIPLQKLQLTDQPSMGEYDALMKRTMLKFRQEGFSHSIFGDIFLEDLKKYREERLSAQGFKAHFPIWKRDTTAVILEFLELGFKAILVCIKSGFIICGLCKCGLNNYCIAIIH